MTIYDHATDARRNVTRRDRCRGKEKSERLMPGEESRSRMYSRHVKLSSTISDSKKFRVCTSLTLGNFGDDSRCFIITTTIHLRTIRLNVYGHEICGRGAKGPGIDGWG